MSHLQAIHKHILLVGTSLFNILKRPCEHQKNEAVDRLCWQLTKCKNCDKIWALSHQKRVPTRLVYTYALVIHSLHRPDNRLVVVHSEREGSVWILITKPLLSKDTSR